jgi:hypothetical protein
LQKNFFVDRLRIADDDETQIFSGIFWKPLECLQFDIAHLVEK